MNIDSLLMKVQAPAAPVEKTAAATASLDDRIDAAIAGLGSQKTAGEKAASESSPVKTLMKVASELAETDADANVKLAHRMGVAFVDGQVERMQQYEKAAAELEASAEQTDAEKTADYQTGFAEATDLIYKAAAAHFVIGSDAITAAIEAR